MLNLDEVFARADAAVNESRKADICEIDSVCTTFADIRDAVAAAAKDALQIVPAEDCVTAYVTCRDGDFVVSPGKPGPDGCVPLKDADSDMWKLPKRQRPYADKTLKDILNAVSGLDAGLFGNGRNYLKCVLAAPPEGREAEYEGKFLAVFPEVAQFDAGMNKIEGEPAGSAEILAAANSCPCARAAQIRDEQVAALKKAEACRKQMEQLEKQLEKMTDGLGWRCTLDQYVDDKYSRRVVNAAMKHGVDVSRDSQFVKSIVRRLAEMAARGRPTKSDLATYAKCDKVDFKSDACREFLADVEQDAERTNGEVLGPILGFAKSLAKAACDLAAAIAAFDGSECKDAVKVQALTEQDQPGKKDIAGITRYFGRGPITRIVGCNGKIYVVTADFSGVEAIAGLFGI